MRRSLLTVPKNLSAITSIVSPIMLWISAAVRVISTSGRVFITSFHESATLFELSQRVPSISKMMLSYILYLSAVQTLILLLR